MWQKLPGAAPVKWCVSNKSTVSPRGISENKTPLFLGPSASRPQLCLFLALKSALNCTQSRPIRLWSPLVLDPQAKQSLSAARPQRWAKSTICSCLTFHINVTYRSCNWCWQVICVSGMHFYWHVCVCVVTISLWSGLLLHPSIPLSLMQWVPRPISLWLESLQHCIRPLITLSAF